MTHQTTLTQEPVAVADSEEGSGIVVPILCLILALYLYLRFKRPADEIPMEVSKRKREYDADNKPDPSRTFTAEQLQAYDGSNPESPLYIAVSGKVYDVTSGENFYGPAGNYKGFAGRDASRALAKLDIMEQGTDVSDLSPSERLTLREWVQKFEEKYWVVGRYVGSASTISPSEAPPLPPRPTTTTQPADTTQQEKTE